MNIDYQSLPRLRDSISYVYCEHAIIEQEDSSIVAIQKDGRITIPVSSLTWIIETKPGVFVGTLHAVVRDKVWKQIETESVKGALMIYSYSDEQGYRIEMIGEPTRKLVDLDGLQLIKRT